MSQILYQFVGSGATEVQAMFRDIDAAAKNTERGVVGSYARQKRAAQGVYRTAPKLADDAADGEIRAAQKTARAEERLWKYRQNMRSRYFAEAQKQEEKAASAWENRKSAMISGGLRAASTIGSAALGVIEKALSESMELQGAASRISITGRASGAEFVDPNVLRKEFEAAAQQAPGVKASDVASGVEKYISLTGDMETARKSAGSFATLASATNSKVEDIAATAASLGEKFNVKDLADMQKSMAILTFQGKQGAFELKDMAGQFQRLSASAAAFDIGQGSDAVALLGGLSQLARSGTGNARMATTAVENMFASFTSKSGELKKEKVDVYDAQGKRRNVKDLLVEAVSRVGGTDLEAKNSKLRKIFGMQGGRMMNPLIAAYTADFEKAGGKGGGKAAQEAGEKAVRAKLDNFIDTAGSWGEIQKDAAFAQQRASAQLTAAWESLKSKVAADVMPAFAALIPKLLPLTEALGPLIGAVGILAEAFVATATLLQKLGLIEKKEEKPLEKVARTKRELDDFEKTFEGRNHLSTPEEAKKRKELQENYEKAKEEEKKPIEKLGFKMNPETFAKEFARAGGEEEGTQGFKDAEFRAKNIYNKIDKNPGGDETSYFLGDKQNQLISDRQAEVNGKAIESATKLGEVAAKWGAVGDKLALAATALAKSAHGTIYAGGGAPLRK